MSEQILGFDITEWVVPGGDDVEKKLQKLLETLERIRTQKGTPPEGSETPIR